MFAPGVELPQSRLQGNGDAALRVLVDDAPVRRARLALVAAVQATLREGLSLLGIAAPEQM